MKRLKLLMCTLFILAAVNIAGAQVTLSFMDGITGAYLEKQVIGKDTTVWLQGKAPLLTELVIPAGVCKTGAYTLSFTSKGTAFTHTILLEKRQLYIRLHTDSAGLISASYGGKDGELNTAHENWWKQQHAQEQFYRQYMDDHKDTFLPTGSNMNKWWQQKENEFQQIRRTALRKWQGRPLEKIILSTWGTYEASMNFTSRSALPSILPINDGLLYTANLMEKKDDEYIQLLLAGQHLSKDALSDTLLKYLPMLLNQAHSNDSLLLYWCYGLRRQFRQVGLDMLEEMLDEQYLSRTCKADNDKDLQHRLQAYKNTRQGRLAPPLSVNGFDLYTLKADTTLVVFWATWCPHCQQELPRLKEQLKGHPGLQVVAVALDNSLAAWEQVIPAFAGWMHLRASGQWDDELVEPYGVTATPTYFMLDKEKHIIHKFSSLTDIHISGK